MNFYSRPSLHSLALPSCADNDEVLEAVKTDGALLRFATEETRESNKEICLAAVSVTGTAIQHCGREFKAENLTFKFPINFFPKKSMNNFQLKSNVKPRVIQVSGGSPAPRNGNATDEHA